MPKIKKEGQKINRENVVKVIPVGGRFGKGKAEINYFTANGKEVPRECVGKKVVNVGSYNAFEKK